MKIIRPATLLLALALMATAPAVAATHNFKLAHVIAAGTPIDVGANKFAELVKQRTNGDVDIKVFPAGQLGGERAIIEGVQLGTIEMSFTTTGAIGGFAPEFQVLDLPFLFPSYEAAYTYLDGAQGSKLLALLDRKGIHGLAYLENGWRNFTSSKRPINTPADVQGQKIRVMESPMYMGLISTMGGSPTPMAYTELPNALLQKVIDGQENPSVNIYSAKMYESQPWMTKDQHTYNVMIAKVNKQVWSALPPNYQKIIAQAALEARDFQRKLNRECDAAFIAKLKEKGMKVHELTNEQRKAFETALQPMYEKGKTIVGEQLVNDAIQFRKDWDGGKYKAEESAYVSAYAKIDVPVKETMANFK